jgi:RHS repeat-associated protein
MNEVSGTRNDSHGTNHLSNNAVTSSTGLKGNAASFSASAPTTPSGYLSITDNPAISGGNIDFTLTANVYLNSTSAIMIIANKGLKNSSERDYLLFYNPTGSKFTLTVGNGTTSGSVVSNETIVAGQWYTVIAWHDSVANKLNIQVNNGSVSSAEYSSGSMDTTYPLSIGAHIDGLNGLNGRIDEFAIYKRVLTVTERTWLYNNGAGQTYIDVNPPSANPGTNGLISWWTMNEMGETRNDSHGTNHLSDNNTIGAALGKQGGAASFVASTPAEFLSIEDNPNISTGNIDFTISANVYLTSTASTAVLVNKGDKVNMNIREYTLYFDQSTSKIGFRVGNGTTSAYILSTSTVTSGQWYTVTAWHNAASDSINLQINEGSVSSGSYTGGGSDNTYPLTIGAFSDGTYGFTGLIDEVAFYKRVLTSAERTWLYNNGLGRTYVDLNPPAQSGWQTRDYTYDIHHPHAASALTENAVPVANYTYDANGNMTCRTEEGVTYLQEYNVENRISGIIKLASGDCAAPGNYAFKWDFGYDGDGVRVFTITTPYDEMGMPLTPEWTAYFFGGAYETRSDGTAIKYYSFAGQTIAMDDGTGLQYFLTDHLGSVVATIDSTGTLTSQQRYLPFGGVRTDVPGPDTPATDYGYTGQRNLDANIGLMDYKARFYSPYINRFIQPDTLIPDSSNPQAWNRYSYVVNRPVNFNDPTGHCYDPLTGTACLTIAVGALVIVGAAWTIAYAFDPNVKQATHQLGQDLAYAAKRWTQKRTWDQGHLIHEEKILAMEADAKKTADDGKIPSDPKWCENNISRCVILGTVTTIGLGVGLVNVIKCAAQMDESCAREAGKKGEKAADWQSFEIKPKITVKQLNDGKMKFQKNRIMYY